MSDACSLIRPKSIFRISAFVLSAFRRLQAKSNALDTNFPVGSLTCTLFDKDFLPLTTKIFPRSLNTLAGRVEKQRVRLRQVYAQNQAKGGWCAHDPERDNSISVFNCRKTLCSTFPHVHGERLQTFLCGLESAAESHIERDFRARKTTFFSAFGLKIKKIFLREKILSAFRASVRVE